MSDQSVASLVERLLKRAEYYEKAGSTIPTALVSSIQLETARELREAASRLSSPEGTRGDDEETPCPKRDDKQHCNCWYDGEACCACGAPASSAPAAAPAKAHGNSSAEVERSRQVQLQALLVDIAQVFDGWHQDGMAWTTHDESVRRRLSEFMEASPRVSAATPATIFDAVVAEGERIANEIARRCPRFDWNPSDGNDSADPAEHIAANINALLDQLASTRLSAATPAPEWKWNEDQPPNGDTPVGRLRLALRQQPERLDDLRQIVVALFAAVSAAERPAQTWQPIESAPMDGNSILVTDGRDVGEGYWGRIFGEWCSARESVGSRPTHWMPLPAPPGQVAP